MIACLLTASIQDAEFLTPNSRQTIFRENDFQGEGHSEYYKLILQFGNFKPDSEITTGLITYFKSACQWQNKT